MIEIMILFLHHRHNMEVVVEKVVFLKVEIENVEVVNIEMVWYLERVWLA